LSRRGYLAELAHSRVAISPFGLGEITLRDFEIFMSGALLLKPDMSEIETWPNLYRGGETMAAYRWDLSDLEEKIDGLLSDAKGASAVAAEGQRAYRDALAGPDAGQKFAEHLRDLIDQCKQDA
jgi:hypothetical protein